MHAAAAAADPPRRRPQNDRVTPVLGKLIENIMAERPADPAQYIVRYLTKSDSMASSAAHWDDLTSQLADAKAAAAAQEEEEEESGNIPMETFTAISSALDPFEAQERVMHRDEICEFFMQRGYY